MTPAEAGYLALLIDFALTEDLSDDGDVTSRATIPDGLKGRAAFVARAPGVLAGIEAAERVCLRVDPKWAMPPGYVTEPTQRAGIQGQIGRAASLDARQKARSTTQMEDIVDRGYVIIGSPDEVVEQLTEVATDLNVGHLMLLLQFGSMGKELAKYNTKLFAERVLPKMKGLFSEWEDRWWPQPMAKPERAAPAAFQPGAMAAE